MGTHKKKGREVLRMGSFWSTGYLTLVRWAQGSPFSGNFLNPGVPSYSLKAFNFPPRNRVGEHRRTGAGPVQSEFPSEPFGME